MSEKLPPLEEGLLRALKAIDNQVAREVQKRSPTDRDEHGVQKWEPLESRVERIAGYVLDLFTEQEVGLDSLLVMSQAMTKVLQIVVSDLGENGLGKVRSAYCLEAAKRLSHDARTVTETLQERVSVM